MNFAYEVKKCSAQKVTFTRGFLAQKCVKKLPISEKYLKSRVVYFKSISDISKQVKKDVQFGHVR